MYLAAGNYFGATLVFDTGLGSTLAFLLLKACLEIAFSGSQQKHAAFASQAAAACPQKNLGVGMRITSSGGQYRVRVKGTTHKPPRRSALIVSCQHLSTGGIQLSLRARARGRPLTQVVGPTLGIGFLNRGTGRAVHVNTAFSVR